METVRNRSFDQERAFYGVKDMLIEKCSFDGLADGESALKECSDIEVKDSYFNLRYPLWHDDTVKIEGCEMTTGCRAALWYTHHCKIVDSKLHGIKALRECSDVNISGCDIVSPEFGWSSGRVIMENTKAESEYFMMRGYDLNFKNVDFKGKYSFQYIKDSVFENCTLDTKDAFWHAENVTVRNCTVKGEHLGWYSKNLTFENCKIIGTQPLCYCQGLRLIDCEMIDTDLAFERSEVFAKLGAPIVSIKNPIGGRIFVPQVGEIIRDIDTADGEVIITEDVKECVCA